KKAAMPLVPGKYKKAAESAWWINHSCTVAPEGEISRRTILMSKNWMNQVWAWDNCFNTLAMAKADKKLAFDQMRIFFDKQTADGMFPDSISSMATRYGHVKPPIYGWTMLQLMQILPEEELLPFIPEAYNAISRQTLWWYENRDPDSNGMCEYLHGNDSGWDNGSLFDQGYPTEGADLAAHLVLQCEALSKMAALSGKGAEAEIWSKKSASQLERLLTRNVHNFRFFSPLRGKTNAKDTKCLLNYVPLELGHRIPSEIWDTMINDLKKEGIFLTANGLATQAISTPEYRPDGYWRGPVWAPSTYLIFTGLVDRNETTLAKTIAERFCDMCAKDEAMWENYDALTGKGLQCPAYTWTSSVFLLLAEWLNKN
ncbi:MAG: trehalase family glycosidase, partial [Bacteroidales bacterium]|nr:trehalase family glycosidase [Bacteroidales bacterium]